MENTSTSRFLLSLAVAASFSITIITLATLLLEAQFQDKIRTDCIAGDYRLVEVCFDKALREGHFALWLYFLPYLPALLVLWASWVWALPFPKNSVFLIPTPTEVLKSSLSF